LNKSTLAILDIDERYLFKLQSLLEERESFPFSVGIYTNISHVMRDIEKGLIDILLISDQLFNPDDNLFRSAKLLVILLGSGVFKSDDIPYIWKFQSGEAIRREILSYYTDHRSVSEKDSKSEGMHYYSGHKSTKIIGIFTPIQRCLQTSFSIHLGQALSETSPALYLNLEPLSNLAPINNPKERDLSDLIYYLRSGNERLIYKLESLVRRIKNLDYIPPARSFIDLSSVSKEDWLLLLDTLTSFGSYDYILLDLTFSVSGLLDVLRRCDYIVSINHTDSYALEKQEQFINILKTLDYTDILTKTKYIDLSMVNLSQNELSALSSSNIMSAVKKYISEELIHGL